MQIKLMGFLDKLLQTVLPADQSTNDGSSVLVKRTLKRSQKYLNDWEEWKNQQSYNFSIRTLKEEWDIRNEIAAIESDFHYYNSPQSCGFVFYFDNGTNNEEASFLFELFKFRVKELDYAINHSEEEVKEEKDCVLTKESYYLKPKLKYRKQPPFHQLYGTIRIEFTSRDGRPYYLKLMANYFSDRSYQEPFTFEELAEQLFVF